MKLHIRYIDTDPFYEVDCVPEIGCDTIQIIATDPYRFTADGWRVNVTQDEDAGLLAVASVSLNKYGLMFPELQIRVDPEKIDFYSFQPVRDLFDKKKYIQMTGSVGEGLARWEVK